LHAKDVTAFVVAVVVAAAAAAAAAVIIIAVVVVSWLLYNSNSVQFCIVTGVSMTRFQHEFKSDRSVAWCYDK